MHAVAVVPRIIRPSQEQAPHETPPGICGGIRNLERFYSAVRNKVGVERGTHPDVSVLLLVNWSEYEAHLLAGACSVGASMGAWVRVT